jgi:hypothetical protein
MTSGADDPAFRGLQIPVLTVKALGIIIVMYLITVFTEVQVQVYIPTQQKQ